MKPRFTDSHKYPTPYVPSGATDLKKTFARVRAQQKAEAEKVIASNVKPLKRKT